jgi:CheY-like chemotaxis protein
MGYTHPVVALTANAVSGSSEMFLANGFDGYISKPIDIRELNALLNRLIRDKQPPEVIEAVRLGMERSKRAASNTAEEKLISNELAIAVALDINNAITVLEDENTDIELFTTTVHGMKSSLANIGETELSGIALKLEQAGNNRDTVIISSETPAFINALQMLIEKVKPSEADGVKAAGQDDIAFLREKLAEIKTACEHINKKTAKEALNELKGKSWSREISGLLDELSMHLLRGEFKMIYAAIEKASKLY